MQPLLVFLLVVSGQTSRPSISSELDEIAAGIATSLASPKDDRFVWDKAYRSFYEDVQFAAVWPHPRFRDALEKLSANSDGEILPAVSIALLNYQEPGLRKLVEKMTSNTSFIPRRSDLVSSVGGIIGNILVKHSVATGFPSSLKEALPIDENGRLASPIGDSCGEYYRDNAGMTIPVALKLLKSSEKVTRLRAFAWLAQHGIVTDVEPLEESWPTLSSKERTALLGAMARPRQRRMVARLRQSCEWILSRKSRDQLSEESQAHLASLLASLHGEHARELAKSLVLMRKKQGGLREDWIYDPLHDELAAFGLALKSEDVPEVIEWLKGGDPTWVGAAAAILVRSDDPKGCKAVLDYFEADDGSSFFMSIAFDADYVLIGRDWPESRIKWKYVQTLNRVLQRRCAAREIDGWPDGFVVSKIITTLEAITQTSNGFDGMMIPGPFVAETARVTAKNWDDWVETNDPFGGRPLP